MKGAGKLLAFVVLAVIAFAALYFFIFRRPAIPPQPPVPDLIALLPADATGMAYIDCVALRSSPLVGRLLASFPAPVEDKEYAEFVRATGFDYTRDLDRLAIAFEPGGRANTSFAVADGRFDREKITAYALRTGKRTQQDGREVLVIPGDKPPKTLHVSFLSANRIAIYDPLAKIPGANPPASDGAMRTRLARISGSPVFGLSRVGEIPKNLRLGGWVSDSLLEIARSVRWITFAAKPEGDLLQVALEAECDSSGNARQLSWTLDGARLIARMALSDPQSKKDMDPAVAAMLETILRDGKISRVDETVRLSFELKSRDLEAALAPAPAKTAR